MAGIKDSYTEAMNNDVDSTCSKLIEALNNVRPDILAEIPEYYDEFKALTERMANLGNMCKMVKDRAVAKERK